MTTATKQAVFSTAHEQMRTNTRAVLDRVLADAATQQASVDNAHTNRATIEAQLQATNQRRTELLAQLKRAQQDAMQAEGARDLAIGTPVEAERATQYEQARAKVNEIYATMQALAETDEANRALMAENDAGIEAAEEALSRIQERVATAQAIFDDVDTKHRESLKEQALAALADARERRSAANMRCASAEEGVAEAQARLAEALSPWYEFAMGVLLEHGEFPPDPGTAFIEEKLRINDWLERQAGIIDPSLRRFLLSDYCYPDVRYFMNNPSRREQKSGGRQAHLTIQQYDTETTRLEQELERRREASRIAAAERTLGNGG